MFCFWSRSPLQPKDPIEEIDVSYRGDGRDSWFLLYRLSWYCLRTAINSIYNYVELYHFARAEQNLKSVITANFNAGSCSILHRGVTFWPKGKHLRCTLPEYEALFSSTHMSNSFIGPVKRSTKHLKEHEPAGGSATKKRVGNPTFAKLN